MGARADLQAVIRAMLNFHTVFVLIKIKRHVFLEMDARWFRIKFTWSSWFKMQVFVCAGVEGSVWVNSGSNNTYAGGTAVWGEGLWPQPFSWCSPPNRQMRSVITRSTPPAAIVGAPSAAGAPLVGHQQPDLITQLIRLWWESGSNRRWDRPLRQLFAA